jgi:hypothetical protein
MPQVLTTKAFGPITIVRSWATTGQHIVELEHGGFARRDGNPIQSEQELIALLPDGPDLQRALDWWHHRDDEEEYAPPDVVFRHGAVVYAATGEPLSSFEEVLAAFPDPGPFQEAALRWFGTRQAQQQAGASDTFGVSPHRGLVEGPESTASEVPPHPAFKPPFPVQKQKPGPKLKAKVKARAPHTPIKEKTNGSTPF